MFFHENISRTSRLPFDENDSLLISSKSRENAMDVGQVGLHFFQKITIMSGTRLYKLFRNKTLESMFKYLISQFRDFGTKRK